MNEFVMFVGPMFGGKTTKLLSAIDRYQYQGRNILAFKPKVDERYSKEEIVTHWRTKMSVKCVSDDNEIEHYLRESQAWSGLESKYVIAVDEAFMINDAGGVLVRLFREGHTVLVSSLQLSSDFTPYDEIQTMLPYATKVEICPAVCSTCAADAYYTKKIGGRKDHAIEVGGAEMYQPKCLEHFMD